MASNETKKPQQQQKNYPKKGGGGSQKSDKHLAKSKPAKTPAKTAPKTATVEVKFDDAAFIKVASDLPLTLMLAGLPGSGKSSLGKALTHLISGAVYTDQDENGSNASKYHAKVASLSSAKDKDGKPLVKCLILGKGHHELTIRQKAAANLVPGYPVTVVQFYHATDMSDGSSASASSSTPTPADKKFANWKAVSMERIKKRGLNHHCLHPNPELGFILNSFASGWTEPTVQEFGARPAQILQLNVSLTKQQAVKNLIIQLCGTGILEPLRDDKGGDVYANDNGDLFFDPYSHLDEPIAQAVKAVKLEEEALRSQLKTRFWAMVLTKSARMELDRHPQVKLALDDSKLKMQSELHSTMLFVKGDVKDAAKITTTPTDGREFKDTRVPTPEFAAAIAKSIEETDEEEMMEYAAKMFASTSSGLGEHTLIATHVVWDSNAVALMLEPTFPCKNAVPHITLAVNTATKTMPFYSNALLAKPVDDASVHRVKFDTPLNLSAYLKRNLA